MIFNFFLGNHRPEDIKGMVDEIMPIYHGLSELGHHTILYGLTMQTAPVVNVLFEFFPDDGFTDGLLKMKADAGDRFRFGLVCTEDLDDPSKFGNPQFPRRRSNLLRVLPAADFVWTLLPQVAAYESVIGPGRTALMEYGYSDRLLNPFARDRRDLDFVMYGNETPYRNGVVDSLRKRGLKGVVTQREILPDFVTADLLSRTKLVLDIRRGPEVRYPSPTRICKAVHSSALVLAEHLGESDLANLYKYTVACGYGELVDRCEQVIRSGAAANLGLAALQQFKAETSMRANLSRAMSLPVFQEFLR